MTVSANTAEELLAFDAWIREMDSDEEMDFLEKLGTDFDEKDKVRMYMTCVMRKGLCCGLSATYRWESKWSWCGDYVKKISGIFPNLDFTYFYSEEFAAFAGMSTYKGGEEITNVDYEYMSADFLKTIALTDYLSWHETFGKYEMHIDSTDEGEWYNFSIREYDNEDEVGKYDGYKIVLCEPCVWSPNFSSTYDAFKLKAEELDNKAKLPSLQSGSTTISQSAYGRNTEVD